MREATVRCEHTRGDGDLELPEIAPDVTAMWARNKPSPLLREYFDTYAKKDRSQMYFTHGYRRVRHAESTVAELVNPVLGKKLLAIPCAQILAWK